MRRRLSLMSLALGMALLAGCHGPLGMLRITQVAADAPVPVAVQATPLVAPSSVTPLDAGGRLGTEANVGGVSGVVYGAAPALATAAFHVAQSAEWLQPVAGAQVEVVDAEGRSLADGPLKTNEVGRFSWDHIRASQPVVTVRASYMVNGRPVVLERAVAAPRLPGGVFVELSPAATLVIKTMRVMAIDKQLDLGALPMQAVEPFTRRVAATMDPDEVVQVGAMTDQAAADRLNRQMAEWPELLEASQALFAEAGASEWGGYLPGYVPPSVVPRHSASGGGSPATPPPPAAGTILATPTIGTSPWAIARAPNGDVWVTLSDDNTVKDVAPDGTVKGTYPVGTTPTAIAFDPTGRPWVACRGSNEVWVLKADGSPDFQMAPGQVPTGIAFSADGTAWVALRDDHAIAHVSTTGALLGTIPAASGPNGPHGMGVDRDGNIWTAGYFDQSLWKFAPDGTLLKQVVVGNKPDYIQFDAAGNVWVSVEDDHKVTRVALDGTILGDYNVGASPYHFAFDASGDAWVANFGDGTVSRLRPDGTLRATYPTGAGALGLAIDGAGNVWVANKGPGTLTKLAP